MPFVVLLYALFASVFTMSKTGLEYTEPLFFIGIRMLLAGAVMLLYQFFSDRSQFTFKKEHWWRLFLLAAFNIYLTNMLEFCGLKYLTSSKTCFIYSLSPFVSAILSYFMFAETITPKKWGGLVIGFCGFLPILLSQTSVEGNLGHLLFFSWAEIAVMGAAVSSVYGWILLRQLINENGYTPFMANGLSMVVGGGIALGHSFMTEKWNPIPVTEVVPFLECAILLIVISNLICYNLYGFLMKRFTATFMSLSGFMTPFFAALFGWLYLEEVVTPAFYLSASIVFCGLLLFYQEELNGIQTRRLQVE